MGVIYKLVFCVVADIIFHAQVEAKGISDESGFKL